MIHIQFTREPSWPSHPFEKWPCAGISPLPVTHLVNNAGMKMLNKRLKPGSHPGIVKNPEIVTQRAKAANARVGEWIQWMPIDYVKLFAAVLSVFSGWLIWVRPQYSFWDLCHQISEVWVWTWTYMMVINWREASHPKLDDGWPESVEEQGLLLLVWRHNFTNNIWKMCYRQSRRGVARQNSEKCKTIVCIANTFTHRHFYTKAFTHRSFYTQKLLHRGYYTQSFYPQKLLHTDAFTHRCFYTQTLLHGHFYTQTRLHTDTFTHKSFYTQELLLHRRFYTQKLLHIDAFTHRHFYTQTLLHTDAFTRRRFYTQKLLHTNAFTHRRFYIQTLLRRNTFTHRRFYTQTVLHTSAFTHNHLFRLKRAVESIECENTTAAWVKTRTELVIQDLEPPSKWNSSDAVKNRREMKTNEVIVW